MYVYVGSFVVAVFFHFFGLCFMLQSRLFRVSSLRGIATFPEISRAQLKITHNTKPKAKVSNDKLVFGKTFTDHMLEIDWESEKVCSEMFYLEIIC